MKTKIQTLRQPTLNIGKTCKEELQLLKMSSTHFFMGNFEPHEMRYGKTMQGKIAAFKKFYKISFNYFLIGLVIFVIKYGEKILDELQL